MTGEVLDIWYLQIMAEFNIQNYQLGNLVAIAERVLGCILKIGSHMVWAFLNSAK